MEAAILAISITRLNNQHFPIPDPYKRNDKDAVEALARKRQLFESLLDSNEELIRALSLIYGNLPLAQVLTEEVQKKS
jgi:hypothetical protein